MAKTIQVFDYTQHIAIERQQAKSILAVCEDGDTIDFSQVRIMVSNFAVCLAEGVSGRNITLTNIKPFQADYFRMYAEDYGFSYRIVAANPAL